MDYFPLMIYTPKLKFWPVIDDALRTAAVEHKINIKLLISWWKHSRVSEDYFLKSLMSITNSYRGVNIEVVLAKQFFFKFYCKHIFPYSEDLLYRKQKSTNLFHTVELTITNIWLPIKLHILAHRIGQVIILPIRLAWHSLWRILQKTTTRILQSLFVTTSRASSNEIGIQIIHTQ